MMLYVCMYVPLVYLCMYCLYCVVLATSARVRGGAVRALLKGIGIDRLIGIIAGIEI